MFKSIKKILVTPAKKMAVIIELDPPYNPLNEFENDTDK